MAFPIYTYTLTNGSTADASQVTQNFNDILNGISDTTKDISVANITGAAAGALTANGNVVLGSSSSKTVTFNASLTTSIPILTNATYDIGSSTLALLSVYLGNSTFTTRVKTAATANYTITLPTTAGTTGLYLKNTDGAATLGWAKPTDDPMAYTSATGTYAVLTTDHLIPCSGVSFTLTLPTAVGVQGKEYVIQHLGTSLTQIYTIATTSAQTVGGIASGSYALYTNGEILGLYSDGTNWQISRRVTRTGWISGGSAVPFYTFTVTAANATVAATYTNNGQTFTVAATIAGATTLICNGTGAAAASGTLTKSAGVGDATITFSVVAGTPNIQATTTIPVFSTTPTTNALKWFRDGSMCTAWYNYYQTATGSATGSGDYLIPWVPNQTIDTTILALYTGGAVQTQINTTTSTLSGWNPSNATGHASSNGSAYYQASHSVPYTSTSCRVYGWYNGAPWYSIGSTFIPANVIISYNFQITMPISGWQP